MDPRVVPILLLAAPQLPTERYPSCRRNGVDAQDRLNFDNFATIIAIVTLQDNRQDRLCHDDQPRNNGQGYHVHIVFDLRRFVHALGQCTVFFWLVS